MRNSEPMKPKWITTTSRPRERRTAPGTTYSNDARYSGSQWRKLRAQVLEAEPLCRECNSRGRVTAAKMVDHIAPVTAGGEFYEWDNLQPLCDSCHARKSAREGNEKRKTQ